MRILLWYSIAAVTVWLLKMGIGVLNLAGLRQVVSLVLLIVFLPIGYFLWATLFGKRTAKIFHLYFFVVVTSLVILPILGTLLNPQGFTIGERIAGFLLIAPVIYYLWIFPKKRTQECP